MKRAATALLLLLAGYSRASAQSAACDDQKHRGLSYDPVTIGFFEADLGTGRRACPRTELRVGGRLGAIVATADFYGAVAADAIISASYSFAGRGEIFATLEAFHYSYVQNATLKGTAQGLGQLTVGASRVVVAYRGLTLSPYVRLMLPTASTTPHVRTVGGEMGLAVDVRPLRILAVHGYIGVDTTAGISAGPTLQRVGVPVSVGLVFAPATWFALAVDLQLHFNYAAPLDYLAPAFALRFRPARTFNVELSAAAPVAGADRHLVLALLSLGYRF